MGTLSHSKTADAKPTPKHSDLVGSTTETSSERRDLRLKLDITAFRDAPKTKISSFGNVFAVCTGDTVDGAKSPDAVRHNHRAEAVCFVRTHPSRSRR